MAERDRCEACGEPSMATLGEVTDGVLSRCGECKSLRLRPTVKIGSLEPEDYGEAYRSGSDGAKTGRLYEIFCRHTKELPFGERALLDVGFGTGEFLDLVRENGWAAAGVDADLNAVNEARERGIEATQCLVGEETPDVGKFDAATLWDVIEHLDNVEKAASWLADVVRPGGLVILVTPSAESIFDFFAHIERRFMSPDRQRLMTLCVNRYHIHRFTRTGLCRLFGRFGFSTRVVKPVQLFSLRPERYMDGFAPGIDGWTNCGRANRLLSRVTYGLVRCSRLCNKILYVGVRESNGPEQGRHGELIGK